MIDLNKKYTLAGNRAQFLDKILTGGKYCNLFKITLSTGYEVVRYISDSGFTCAGDCLVEDNPYKDFKIDDKVIVWDNPAIGCFPAKYSGHFAGVNNAGKPMYWTHGGTSYTRSITERQVVDNCVKG